MITMPLRRCDGSLPFVFGRPWGAVFLFWGFPLSDYIIRHHMSDVNTAACTNMIYDFYAIYTISYKNK